MSFISIISSAKTVLGIETLENEQFDILKGKRVGLITNSTGMNSDFKLTSDILHEAKNVTLVALFAPEHGIRGDVHAGNQVESYKDSKTGIQVYSIYGKTRKPTPDMLKNIDALVYDIQDIGCRSYTFISSMGLAMEAAAENNIEFIVLDRPNPLGGEKIEGCFTEDNCVSFVSQFKIPYLYGLTCGELALYLNEEGLLAKKCNLTIVPMKNWTRSMTWNETGLDWIPTSPHIPNTESAIFYPTTGLLGELNFISIGVGYTLPFQIIGAPWISAEDLSAKLTQKKVEGVIFRPIHFKPFYGLFKEEDCEGVQIHITNYKRVYLSEIQFIIIEALCELYPDKTAFNESNKNRFAMFDKVCGSKYIRTQLSKNYHWSNIKPYWNKDEEAFRMASKKYYLYQ